MRVTAGVLRGRRLQVPDIPGLRPTPAKVRQALFNILGSVEGLRLLELFSGSGIMALESLSRGAAAVVSVEQNGKAVRHLQQLREALALGHSWQIVPLEVKRGLAGLAGQHFDLVFADPPYESGHSDSLPLLLTQYGIGCDMLVIEESARARPQWPEGWHCLRSRRYGDSCLHFLRPDGAEPDRRFP